MPLYDFAQGYLDWVEEAPSLFFLSGPVMLGIGAVLLFVEAERSRRRQESRRHIGWILFAALLFTGVVVSYAIVKGLHG